MSVAMFSFGAILVRHLAITWQECYGLGDHDWTSLGHLWAFCGLKFQIFTPLYIIVVLNTQRFGAYVSKIGEFGE